MTSFLFRCPYCIYFSDRKYNLNKHLINKHKKNILEKQNVSPPGQNVSPPGQNVSPLGQIVSPNEEKINLNKMMCFKCNKIYKTKKRLIEHEKICKGVDDLTCPKCMMSFTTRSAKSRHIKLNNCKARSIIHARTPNQQNVNNIQTQQNAETINNTNNIDKSITNNTTNNIININNYGNERTDYITKDELYKILLSGNNTIPKYIEHKHFNEDFPENNNIVYTNENKCKVMENDQWKEKDITSMSKKLIKENTRVLMLYCNENEVELKDNIQNEEIFDHVKNKLFIVYTKSDNDKYNDVLVSIKEFIKNWKVE